MLALAAEKDDLNETMITTGLASGDSNFVGGWYQMSSYAWPIGFLSGLLNVEHGGQEVTQCDVLAADPYDPKRRAFGILLSDVDATKAELVCRAETVLHPEDGRALYQLARVISNDMSREGEFMPVARKAAEMGVSPATALIGYTLGQKKDDTGSGAAYRLAAQQTILELFATLYPFLEAHAKTDRDRMGLVWYARQAGDLGMPEGQLAEARLTDDPVEKLFHLRLAVRLFSNDGGNNQAAADALNQAAAISVTQAQSDKVDADVAAWNAKPLIELPADTGADG